jgi:hypothetical protein
MYPVAPVTTTRGRCGGADGKRVEIEYTGGVRVCATGVLLLR